MKIKINRRTLRKLKKKNDPRLYFYELGSLTSRLHNGDPNVKVVEIEDPLSDEKEKTKVIQEYSDNGELLSEYGFNGEFDFLLN